MAPVALLAEDVTDDDFQLDMQTVESTTPVVIMMCETNDTCGSSCEDSACASGSYDPF